MENLIIIMILAVVLLYGLRSTIRHLKGEGGGCCGGGSSAVVKRKRLKQVIAVKTIWIDGMSCKHCKNKVEQRLNELEGVSARVSLKKKQAVVSLAKPVSDEQLCSIIENAGYKVVKVADA